MPSLSAGCRPPPGPTAASRSRSDVIARGDRRARARAMTEISLYNTRTRRKEQLRPLDPENVRMYVCGPTVYDRAHIGNARPVVVFDVLYRLLRHVHGPDHVTYVRNITDVDDKINARAAATGRPIRDITEETVAWYRDDMAALGALPPTHEPRATEYIAEMIAMIEALIARRHAYEAEGHVLFSVASYPDYGQFARRSLDEMRAGARVEVAPYKRDPMDFVLWKPSDTGLPGWESPWGRGRPGWHIECSAMSHALLGGSFDIHGGGIDLMFPHHENEIAQSRCAHPGEDFARVWMHNGFLQVEGEKMSKSLGNFFTVKDLLESGWPGEVIRFMLLRAHYRQPLDWSRDAAKEAMKELAGWYRFPDFMKGEASEPTHDIIASLADDLNTPEMLRVLRDLAKGHHYEALSSSLRFLGFTGQWFFDMLPSKEVSRRVGDLVARLDALRDARDYEAADRLRTGLAAAGVEVRSSRGGSEYSVTTSFDPDKLEALE